MFHRNDKVMVSHHTKSLKDLTAVVSPAAFLAEGKRPHLIEKMAENSALETPRFESLCLTLIQNLVHHCQQLPETANSYYSQSGGLMDFALNRTEAALDLFRNYIVPDDGGHLSEEQKLWIYALFSAGMLQGMGKLQIDYRVDLYDLNGQMLKQWMPLVEGIGKVGEYYFYEFLPEGDDDLRRRLNILIAKQLLPASGFAWIISNPEVLAVWLALLHEDAQGAGALGAILIRANAIAVQRYFQEFLVRAGHRSRQGRMGTFLDSVPEEITEKMAGLEFIQWLNQSLESGKLMINKAPLLMVPGGMLLSVDMFKLFIREHPEFKNWLAVQNGFLSLGLHQMGKEGAVSRVESGGKMLEGVIFSQYAVGLPAQFQVNQTTGNTTSMTAIELINSAQSGFSGEGVSPSMQQMAPSGRWVAEGSSSPTTGPKPGTMPHG